MKIYTKTGDDGSTALFAGGRVRKTHERVEAYGTVDELNSIIGLIRAHDIPQQAETWLDDIQNVLFVVGSDLATPHDAKADWLTRLDETPTQRLEAAIDNMDAQLAPLKAFILPGGTLAAAHTHIARTVCRRAERVVVGLAEHETINAQVQIYLNRLSDFLFTLARWLNYQAGETETTWQSRS